MNLVIIQARMGSSRLPGKVLKKIKGYTLLEIQQMRIKPSQLVDQIVIATTTNPEDDVIATFCLEKNISYSRGSDWDVLDRYYQAAKKYNPVNVIRLTSDCPLHHYSVVDFVIDEYLKSEKDYFSNSNNEPDFLEDGFDVEVFSFKALEAAWKEAKLLSEREHVTPYIKNSGKFSCAWKKYNKDYQYKLSVDSENDFKAVEMIFNSFDTLTDFGMDNVLSLLKLKPEILKLNKESIINSGYTKSIQNDKKI
ncbi:MAG: glycosyltransferase family protein [Bacteroidia bacterium]|nr:glycosyltransferase family protein [Bacteroidia bacterium]